ncbi:PLP-dependent aminotransferase family protein [Aquihabitans sp. G128]|uniref:aminotransferase-like domain-containing protein n=1 Tax=Aquihabitans sp. G128 TaxID=2849779 RepID=UPI001C243CE4|nr:PLP-dependent aminotransferase family protein [Aquihabitans sp. G128]QXC59671.1 PLP-dependent aminotransferase family protein [Aquihabitans sp. G128]
MPLDRGRPEPLYVQLADLLAEQIDAGVYRPGERIPSVRRLREQHDVSLTTAVEAGRVLEARGLVRNRPRSGAFVIRPAESGAQPPAAASASLRTRRVDAPLSLRLNLGIGNPQRPTLGAAVQGPELMAVPALNRLLSQALRLRPTECHSYDAPPGSPDLRRAIAQRGTDAGYRVTADDVVITSGAKEAVYLSIRAVTRPGDTVAIESPAYYALLEVLASLQLRVVEVPSHPVRGIDLAALANVLDRHAIAAVALVSNYSNPSGSCMADDDKRALVDLLDLHDVPLVEDDVYGDLAFDGVRPKAIKAFDTQGRVLYCASFSKTLSPGLRVGWAIPGRHQGALEHLKLVVNQATATAPQLAVAAFLETGGFDRHLRRVRRLYRDQLDQVTHAVERHLPPDTRHTAPHGGHVLWVQVPGLDALALYDTAAAQGVHIAPRPPLLGPARLRRPPPPQHRLPVHRRHRPPARPPRSPHRRPAPNGPLTPERPGPAVTRTRSATGCAKRRAAASNGRLSAGTQVC